MRNIMREGASTTEMLELIGHYAVQLHAIKTGRLKPVYYMSAEDCESTLMVAINEYMDRTTMNMNWRQ